MRQFLKNPNYSHLVAAQERLLSIIVTVMSVTIIMGFLPLLLL